MFSLNDVKVDFEKSEDGDDILSIKINMDQKIMLADIFEDDEDLEESLEDIQKEIFELVDEYLEEIKDDLEGYFPEEENV